MAAPAVQGSIPSITPEQVKAVKSALHILYDIIRSSANEFGDIFRDIVTSLRSAATDEQNAQFDSSFVKSLLGAATFEYMLLTLRTQLRRAGASNAFELPSDYTCHTLSEDAAGRQLDDLVAIIPLLREAVAVIGSYTPPPTEAGEEDSYIDDFLDQRYRDNALSRIAARRLIHLWDEPVSTMYLNQLKARNIQTRTTSTVLRNALETADETRTRLFTTELAPDNMDQLLLATDRAIHLVCFYLRTRMTLLRIRLSKFGALVDAAESAVGPLDVEKRFVTRQERLNAVEAVESLDRSESKYEPYTEPTFSSWLSNRLVRR